MARSVSAAFIFIVLSVAMTWPLAVNLDRAVSDPGDPYLNIWILDWDWWGTLHQPLSLFDANAFHPANDSLAFSENLYGVALLLFPLRAAGIDPITAYNVAMLAGFAFSGFAAFLLGQRLTGSFVAGLAGGVFYAFVPFRFIHLSHVQHVWGGWLPMLLVALLAYADRPTAKRAALFAAVFVMNGLTNIHYLLFGSFAIAVTAALLIPRTAWRNLLLAMFAALLILAPFLYPYYEVSKLYGMTRTWLDQYSYSATAADWLPGQVDAEKRLYPGLMAFVGAVSALIFARKEKAKLALALLWVAIGFVGSLGMNSVFHEFLFGAVPGFKAVRVPARWAVIAHVGLSIMLALATAVLARRNRWIALIVPVAVVADLWVAPVRWFLADPVVPEVHQWIAKQKDVKVIAELPFDVLSSEYEAMLHATAHHKRMVNGVSGFAPKLRIEMADLSRQSPIPDRFLDLLEEVSVDHIIIHGDLLGGGEGNVNNWLDRELARGRLSYVASFDSRIRGDHVYRIGGNGPRVRRSDSPCRSIIAALDSPPPGFTFKEGGIFSGYAISPHGIRSVDLWFNNRRLRHRATLSPAELPEHCRDRPRATRVRFLGFYRSRPKEIRPVTDVQVEVTDGRGVRKVLEHRWIQWE